jgi:hypothetical protein
MYEDEITQLVGMVGRLASVCVTSLLPSDDRVFAGSQGLPRSRARAAVIACKGDVMRACVSDANPERNVRLFFDEFREDRLR